MAQPMFPMAIALVAAVVTVRGALPTMEERTAAGECPSVMPYGDKTYFPTDVQEKMTESADLFDIKYASTFKVVITHMAKEQYVLTQCGMPRPTDADVRAVAPVEDSYIRKYFEVPLLSAAAGSTVHLTFLDNIGVQDRIMFVDQWASGACWQKAVGCGAVLDAGGKWGNDTKRAEQTSKVEAVFMSCTSTTNCTNVHSQANGVHVPSSQDPSPLKTAEYIKFFGAFFNKEHKAHTVFSAVNTTYKLAAVDTTLKPTVAWVAYSNYRGHFFKVSLADYKKVMVADAGGANFDAAMLLKDITGLEIKSGGTSYDVNLTVFNTTAQDTLQTMKDKAGALLFEALKDVDVVIDETYAPDPDVYTFDTFKSNFGLNGDEQYDFLTKKKVLRYDGEISETKGLDWFESRMARPDLAVAGLSRCLHGDSAKTVRKYFRNIALDQPETPIVIKKSSCTSTLPACEASAKPETIMALATVPPQTTAAPTEADAARPLAASLPAALASAAALAAAAFSASAGW